MPSHYTSRFFPELGISLYRDIIVLQISCYRDIITCRWLWTLIYLFQSMNNTSLGVNVKEICWSQSI